MTYFARNLHWETGHTSPGSLKLFSSLRSAVSRSKLWKSKELKNPRITPETDIAGPGLWWGRDDTSVALGQARNSSWRYERPGAPQCKSDGRWFRSDQNHRPDEN